MHIVRFVCDCCLSDLLPLISGHRYLNDDFRRLDLNPCPESRYLCILLFNSKLLTWSIRFFPFRPTLTCHAVSEARNIENLGLNDLAQELPTVPSGPLPPFRFPWATPRTISRGFADRGHSLVEISITYNPEAVPGEPTLEHFSMSRSSHGAARLAAVYLRLASR